jgi:hypothetical protein
MEYKLKFEIDYSNMSKDKIRDSKLSEVLGGDKEMLEITIDPSIKIPLIDDVVILGDKEYKIMSNKYKIESDCYTTILLVKSIEEIERLRKKEGDDMRNRMSQMLSSI